MTKDIPPYAVVGGVPAKVIKYRFDEEQIEKLLRLQWWEMDPEDLRSKFLQFHNVKEFLDGFENESSGG